MLRPVARLRHPASSTLEIIPKKYHLSIGIEKFAPSEGKEAETTRIFQ